LRQWLWRVPASVIDKGLAAAVAVAVAVGVSPRPGARPVDVSCLRAGIDDRRIGAGPAALAGGRPGASAAILHVYYLLDYPGVGILASQWW
jgi:hypothetical protein